MTIEHKRWKGIRRYIYYGMFVAGCLVGSSTSSYLYENHVIPSRYGTLEQSEQSSETGLGFEYATDPQSFAEGMYEDIVGTGNETISQTNALPFIDSHGLRYNIHNEPYIK